MGLCCCVRAFSSCGERGLLFVAVRGLLIVVASLVVEHGLQARGLSSCSSWALERRLSSCGARAQLLRGMWDLPGPGLEPVSPALAGGFLTTVPPGKPHSDKFLNYNIFICFFFLLQKCFVSYRFGKHRKANTHTQMYPISTQEKIAIQDCGECAFIIYGPGLPLRACP